ncbi:MAG: hypothetical protein M3245_02070 [Actinomycetota bacterium]|nr:hypothetical protein [Actinomycetota bacterium]
MKPRLHLFRRLVAAAAVLIALAACGGDPSVGDGPPATSPGASPASPVVPTTAGEVTVAVRAAALQPGEPLLAAVVNGLDRPIHTEDQKADCSILRLDRSEGEEWVEVPACPQRRPPAEVRIRPGEGETVTIDTASDAFTTPEGDPALVPGTYRLRLTYRVGGGDQGDEPETAVSAEFLIR